MTFYFCVIPEIEVVCFFFFLLMLTLIKIKNFTFLFDFLCLKFLPFFVGYSRRKWRQKKKKIEKIEFEMKYKLLYSLLCFSKIFNKVVKKRQQEKQKKNNRFHFTILQGYKQIKCLTTKNCTYMCSQMRSIYQSSKANVSAIAIAIAIAFINTISKYQQENLYVKCIFIIKYHDEHYHYHHYQCSLLNRILCLYGYISMPKKFIAKSYKKKKKKKQEKQQNKDNFSISCIYF